MSTKALDAIEARVAVLAPDAEAADLLTLAQAVSAARHGPQGGWLRSSTRTRTRTTTATRTLNTTHTFHRGRTRTSSKVTYLDGQNDRGKTGFR